jgi:hypothetical protein
MRAPRKEDIAERRPRLSVVRSELRLRESAELRLRESALERVPSRRLPAHPLEYDERGFPVDQPPLTGAGRPGRFVTR